MSSDGPRKTSSFTLLELETVGGFEEGQSDLHLNLVSGAAVLRMRVQEQGEKQGCIVRRLMQLSRQEIGLSQEDGKKGSDFLYMLKSSQQDLLMKLDAG